MSLDIGRIKGELPDLVIGSDLRYFATIDSTNRVARDLASNGCREGTVVIADYQDSGRGRQGREWIAPPGSSLLVTVILQAPSTAPVSYCVMAGALAVSDAVRDETGLDTQLKWPNDVVRHGRKLCGILADHATVDSDSWVLLGIGINVNFSPELLGDIGVTATSLNQELGRTVSREALAVGLFKRLELWYGYLTQDRSCIYAAWAARLETIGRSVLVKETRKNWQGVAIGVQRDGALLVLDDKGESHAVYAADVSVRYASSFTVR